MSGKKPGDLPEEASSLSNLLISQSKEPENWAQFFLFPLISAAERRTEKHQEEKDMTKKVLLLCPQSFLDGMCVIVWNTVI